MRIIPRNNHVLVKLIETPTIGKLSIPISSMWSYGVVLEGPEVLSGKIVMFPEFLSPNFIRLGASNRVLILPEDEIVAEYIPTVDLSDKPEISGRVVGYL